MKDYAVIRIRGKQFKVFSSEEILVPGKCNEKVEYDLLLQVINGKVEIGKPIIKNPKIKIKLVESNIKGEKVEVVKYKAKSRYRRKMGFRSMSTKLLIQKLN